MLCDLRGEKIIATTFCEHKNPVTAIAISPDGTTVASVSEKGTVIKLYKTPLSQGVTQGFAYLHEIRRGKMFADVYSLSFSPDGKLVALISSTRTVHVFYTEYCYFNNKRSCETLLKSAGHFIDMTFLDNNNICLLYHEDGVLRVSSIDDLPKLNNNFASVL